MGSVMHNAPVLQHNMRVILHKQEVSIGISVYMDEVQNKDQHKQPLSIGI